VTPGTVAYVSIPSSAATAWGSGVQSNAVRVRSTYEVAVVAHNGKPFVNDRALALPDELLGTDYRVMSWQPTSNDRSEFAVVAVEDGTTQVVIDNVPVPQQVSLARGQGLLVSNASDLTNAHVRADKKVVVANGVTCGSTPPSGGKYCDHLYEIALSVDRWGTDYLVRSNRQRTLQSGRGNQRSYYRVIASQDGTLLSVNGSATIPMSAGWTRDIGPSDPLYAFDLHFAANKPIFVAQFMSSICDEYPQDPSCTGGSWLVRGDASMSNLVPTGRFPRRYLFETRSNYGSTGDCSWTSALTVVAPTADALAGSILVDGTPVPAASFTSFATAAGWSVATVGLSCTVHPHTSDSPNGHAAYFIGLGGDSAITMPLGYDYQ
jgi:hypothetical protein